MEKGDLSAYAAPRAVFVWEGLLAKMDPRRAKREARALKMHRWKTALGLWEEDITMKHRVHDMGWRLGLNVDILCTHPSGYADALRERLDVEAYPYNRFYNLDLFAFQSELPHLPEVTAVFHGDEGTPFLFGSKGRLVTDPSRMSL